MCEVQATAAWQWFNWTVERIPAGKKPLRLNFDETSCRLFYEAREGVLGSEPIAACSKKGFIAHRVTRGQSRGALSLLAVIGDDPEIQPKLPQVIIGNQHILAEKVRAQLATQSLLMPKVEVLRRKSA